LERPRDSHRSFPEDIQGVAAQVDWALQQIQHRSQELLDEADYGSAAQILEPVLVQTAIDAIRSHLDKQGPLRSKAIEENLIAP
jgi:hypothetical protein